MKILVLGDSDTSRGIEGSHSWTRIAAEEFAARTGEPFELVETTLLPVGDRAARIAQQRVEEHDPDVVILPVGAWVFASGFVWLRMRRLFGDRAGRWFRGLEMGFDDATRSGSGARKRLNRTIRWVARHVIGTEPFTTREEATRAIEGALQTLSRTEDLQVVVVAYAGVGDALHKPAVAAERERFLLDLREAAGRRRYAWVDCGAAFAEAAAAGGSTTMDDGLHMNRTGSEILGALVSGALVAGRANAAETNAGSGF